MQDAFALDGRAVFAGRRPAGRFGDGFEHAAFETAVGRFEFLSHDRVAFGRYGVTQDDAGGRFVVAPLHLPGDVAAEGGVGGKNGGLVVAERDEHHPVCGFVAVAGDGLLVGREHLDVLDVVGRDRRDLLGFDAVDYI